MECPHLSESIQITTPTMKNENPPSEWCCAVCKSKQSPWLCLGCGVINCGRYVQAHAKAHFEERSSAHCVCMDCNTLATFCYICDEFVINDTSLGQLENIRTQLQSLASTQNNIKENRGRSRRHSADSTKDNKKRLKTDNGTRLSTKIKTSGLRNLGNTCFMNAVLQSLSNIQSFCGYIKQLPSLEVKAKKRVHKTRSKCSGGDDVLLIEELRKTLVSLWQGSKSAISPESLFSVIWKVVPRFRGYQQQDAHEFMRYLLDRLHTELLTLLPFPESSSPVLGLKGRSTIVTTVFGGLLQSEVNCLTCGMYSKKHDPFLDLSLDIPLRFTAKSAKPKEGETLCHLSDCLSSFTDLEELEESEFYKCANCKRRQRSTKKFWIRRLPNVLCLHLKRFRWSSHFREKVETYVRFPLNGLDMTGYLLSNLHETRNSCSGSNEYDLAAVIVHHGSGAGSGHYTSYAIHEGCWYHFNDSSISACEEETVAKCKAYILFYVRRELKIPNCHNNSDCASTSG